MNTVNFKRKPSLEERTSRSEGWHQEGTQRAAPPLWMWGLGETAQETLHSTIMECLTLKRWGIHRCYLGFAKTWNSSRIIWRFTQILEAYFYKWIHLGLKHLFSSSSSSPSPRLNSSTGHQQVSHPGRRKAGLGSRDHEKIATESQSLLKAGGGGAVYSKPLRSHPRSARGFKASYFAFAPTSSFHRQEHRLQQPGAIW